MFFNDLYRSIVLRGVMRIRHAQGTFSRVGCQR
jgi:hypothetical protein